MSALSNGVTLPGPNRATAAVREKTAPTRPAERAPSKRKKRLLRWILLLLLPLGVGAGVWFWMYSSQFEATDDAYVTGNEHPVSFLSTRQPTLLSG